MKLTKSILQNLINETFQEASMDRPEAQDDPSLRIPGGAKPGLVAQAVEDPEGVIGLLQGDEQSYEGEQLVGLKGLVQELLPMVEKEVAKAGDIEQMVFLISKLGAIVNPQELAAANITLSNFLDAPGRLRREGKPDKGQKKSTKEWGKKARKRDDKSRAQGKKASREREKEERGKRSEAKLEE
jgi:hypothetical protein